jgi:Dienelactone hydrolase family
MELHWSQINKNSQDKMACTWNIWRQRPSYSSIQFRAALDSIGIQNEIHIYKGLGHAFANPSGANYAPNETVDAWQKTLAFLKIAGIIFHLVSSLNT